MKQVKKDHLILSLETIQSFNDEILNYFKGYDIRNDLDYIHLLNELDHKDMCDIHFRALKVKQYIEDTIDGIQKGVYE